MIKEPFKPDGKTALVTGARRGIGRAIAVALAEAGADIIGVSQSGDMAQTEAAVKKQAVILPLMLATLQTGRLYRHLSNRYKSIAHKLISWLTMPEQFYVSRRWNIKALSEKIRRYSTKYQ